VFPLPKLDSVLDLYYGKDPYLDAWILHFMTENNIEHLANPYENASPEQLKFMVDLDENQIFAPCSDWMLKNLLYSEKSEELKKEYRDLWKNMAKLIYSIVSDEYIRKKIITLCKHKFQKAYRSPFVIPSRLNKRMLTIVLSQSAQMDPYSKRKHLFNERAKNFTDTQVFSQFISACPIDQMRCESIQALRNDLDLIELKRLFCLSFQEEIWKQGKLYQSNSLLKQMDGFEGVLSKGLFSSGDGEELTILYLPNSSGGIVFDTLIIKRLIRMGHRVILALKEGFYFDYPTFWDREYCPVLEKIFEDVRFIEDREVSKKALLKHLNEARLVVISDGTRERLNLYRTSVTFARAWKESDLIIAKGNGNYRRLIMNSHKFTRDIIAIYRDESGIISFSFKEKSPRVRKITEKEIILKAKSIIEELRRAKANGQKIMFYSAIVGSIPGQTKVAIEVLNTFVKYLREKLDGTFIINPAEHFEPGMDGDDLMYMWEMVQRSGLIDIWRFQTVSDIEKSFELMGKKVPPIWAGKDATFSTGCTKEMRIALEEQKKHPEMQIIGPDPEKFFRRREYGLGKYFDATIERSEYKLN
jgi:uncharacterized protein with ATP-grasp and redox domains